MNKSIMYLVKNGNPEIVVPFLIKLVNGYKPDYSLLEITSIIIYGNNFHQTEDWNYTIDIDNNELHVYSGGSIVDVVFKLDNIPDNWLSIINRQYRF